MDITQAKLNAEILGFDNVEEYYALLGENGEKLQQLIAKLTESNTAQDAADLLQKSALSDQEKLLAKLTSTRINQIADGAVQPAKAAAADQKATAIETAANALRAGLDTRQDTREGAFANTISRLELDVSEGGQGDRANRTLDEIARQNDVITNGGKAARELSTDSSLKGFFTRGLVGNPYADGVAELKGVQDDVKGSLDGLVGSATNLINTAISKDTPLSELTANFNADVTQAGADADSLLQTGLIAPEASQLAAQGTAAEIQQVTTAGNLVAQRFDIDANARDRDNSIAQFQFNAESSVNNNLISQGATLGLQAATFRASNPDGSLFDTTTGVAQDTVNRSTILANNTERSTKTLAVDNATGALDPVAAKAKADSDADFVSFQRNISKSEAALRGIGESGVIDPKLAATAAKTYARDLSTKYTESGTAEIIARRQLETVGQTLDNQGLQRDIDTKTLKSRTKTIAQELGNLESQILLTEQELKLASVKVNVSLETKATWTEAQRLQHQNNLIEAQQKAKLLADQRYLRAQLITGVEGAQVTAAQAQQENRFLQDTETQAKELATRKAAAAELHRQAIATGSPEAIATSNRNRSNVAKRTQIESQELTAQLKYVNSPEFIQDSVDQRRAKSALIKQEYIVKKAELEAAIENQPAVNTLNKSQLALEQKNADNAYVVASDSALQEVKLEADRARSNVAISQGQTLIREGVTTANNTALVNDSYNKLLGKTGDARLDGKTEKFKPNSVEAKILLEYANNGNKFSDNPYANMEKLNKIQAGQGVGPVYTQVVTELRNMMGVLPVTKKLTDNSALINAGIAKIMSGKATKKLDSTSKTNTILDVPKRNSIIGVLPTTMQEAVSSVSNWDDGSMQQKLRGLRDFYTAEAERQQAIGNVTGPIIPEVAGKIASTMRRVMDTKARLGKFSALGIPEYTSLNFNVPVSSRVVDADGSIDVTRIRADRNIFQRGIDAVSDAAADEKSMQFDVFDPTSIRKLILTGDI